jgi:hypothetical protein
MELNQRHDDDDVLNCNKIRLNKKHDSVPLNSLIKHLATSLDL